MIRRASGILALAAISVAAGPGVNEANAQYFGRNQVQYHSFDFKVLQTENFDIYFYPEISDAAEIAGVMAERWYARLSRLLNHKLRGRQVVIFYGSHPEFQQTNTIGAAPGEGTGGVTEVFKRRTVMPFAGPLRETDHVLGHELVHAFQFDMTGQGKTISQNTIPVALRLPLWFIEGMAEYLSVGPNDPHTSMWIRDASANDRLPSIGQLYDPRYFPYRFGQAFWAYIAGRWGDDVVGRILNAAARTGSAEHAIQLVLRIPIDSLIQDWHEAIETSYSEVGDHALSADEFSTLLLSDSNSGSLNTSPALSPRGEAVIFLSEKDLFSVEMFRADVATGRVEKKIVKTALDPHYQSVQFLGSAGSWSFQGDRFVFGAVVKGRAALAIVDPVSGERVREEVIREVGEIFNPTWSPDGRYVAFAAVRGGLSDIYAFDLEADTLLRLTNDAYADMQPAWSPDGRQIAFVTDRFSSDLRNLSFGNYRLAVFDWSTREIRPIPSFAKGKNINPQWSRTGQDLYFLANPTGITNAYRLELASSQIFRITNLYTGISGITALSPALSSASDADRIAFSVYEKGDYNVYTIEDPETLRGTPIPVTLVADNGPQVEIVEGATDAPLAFQAGVLPPNNRDPGDIEAYLDDPDYGLTDQNAFGVEPYKPSLSLDFVSQPTLTAGTDRFGTFIGGGASAFWSDMLGRHNLATQLQIQGSLKDVAAVVGYTNRQNRWNWGAVVGQIPFIRGGFFAARGIEQGQPVFIESRELIKQFNRQVTGVLSYPFSRVSRVEFTGGFQNISFSREVRTIVTSELTGAKIRDEKIDLPTFDALNLVTSSVAFVYDNSFFGATAPILGQRHRFEVTPSVGSLNYVSTLVDMRKYIMPVRPFTFAFRAMHFGRYGGSAEDEVLTDLFLGYPSQIRGYDFNSFSGAECGAGPECPVLDRLFGSRMIVANAELRFPLFGALGIGQGMFGILPVDFVVFGDAGLAWDSQNSDIRALGLGCETNCREPVYSAGAGLRINLLGFLIMEVDYVKPFQRPQKGTHWQFSFVPGF